MCRFKLSEEPKVVFKEQPKVIDLKFHHGNAFYSHSKSISTVD